jgi:DNA helicase HerA-like ATPase
MVSQKVEPALNIDDLLQTDGKGRGVINILSADKLMMSPLVSSTFLLWLLSELFERLPEVGDIEKPKLVFFFDEAPLLFKESTCVVDTGSRLSLPPIFRHRNTHKFYQYNQ